MNRIELIREVLETHRIGPKEGWKPIRCVGCTWIGWSHDQHLAEMIEETIREITP